MVWPLVKPTELLESEWYRLLPEREQEACLFDVIYVNLGLVGLLVELVDVTCGFTSLQDLIV